MPDSPLPALLIVEDDARLGPLMAEILGDSYDVTLVQDGLAGLDAVLSNGFEAVVLDRRLPEMDGLELLRRVRAAGRRVPILLLSAYGTLQDRVEGLDSGANDYLVKPFETEELLARLRALRRASAIEETVLDIGGWRFYPDGRALTSPGQDRIALTEKESDILRLLAESPDRTFAPERILHSVFPEGEKLGVVRTYVHYIRHKTVPELIATVRGVGYQVGRPER
jgi:two-component system response regulator QseB